VIAGAERDRLLAVGCDLATVWHAPTTTPRDRKELLRALLEEVILSVDREKSNAHLTLRWQGGALSELDVNLPRPKPQIVRTDEDTIALVRRLAMHYPDAVIAGILNKQDRKTAYGHRFETSHVANLRYRWKIPPFEPRTVSSDDDLLSVKKAAAALGVAPSTLHRLLNDGIIGGEQLTPGAPWRIRLTDAIKARFNQVIRDGFLPIRDAMLALGVSRQTVLQRVKRGELEAIHVMRGKQKGLCIKVIKKQADLFNQSS
jgi:predicted DNA-binding transcriptional regulator AlpA